MQKNAYRTTTPFDGLSPTTNKSTVTPLFGDTPLIQDILQNNPNGGRDYELYGGDDWSEDEYLSKSYRDRGEDYKIESKIAEMIKRDPSRMKDELWVAIDHDNKRHHFTTYEALQRKLRNGNFTFKSVSKLAQKNNFVEQSIQSCVMVESVAPNNLTKEIGAAFGIGNGLFITCAHVIQRYDKNKMPREVQGKQITLKQGQRFDRATLVASDPKLDLAVLKSNFKTAILPLGESRNAEIGSSVFAVGSPSGFENNFTEGVLSSRDRRVFYYAGAPLFIFTDAQVLPGNSGGPLVSHNQKAVVGMVSLIVGGQGLYGLNAALPVEYIIDFLQKNGLR